MLRPRIIPVLLIHRGGLTKTVQFAQGKYVGDPLNAVRIFNEKEVDEIVIVDIDATINRKEPDYKLIQLLAAESRMPLCYGGGVKTTLQIERIVSLGVEKVAISSGFIENPELVTKASAKVGSQSIVVVLDVKQKGIFNNHYEVYTHNGTCSTSWDPAALAAKAQACGAGEIMVNSIDRDGGMKGYDFNLIKLVRGAISIPITAVGGAGSIQDISRLIENFGIIGAAAGSLFLFKGKYRAVLINYPERNEREKLTLALQNSI